VLRERQRSGVCSPTPTRSRATHHPCRSGGLRPLPLACPISGYPFPSPVADLVGVVLSPPSVPCSTQLALPVKATLGFLELLLQRSETIEHDSRHVSVLRSLRPRGLRHCSIYSMFIIADFCRLMIFPVFYSHDGNTYNRKRPIMQVGRRVSSGVVKGATAILPLV
jgi:hypothetical protein